MHLVLIGMPGCGKTAVGTLLSRRLGLPLLDTDAMVEASAGMTIPALFAAEGEARFRDLETAAAKTAAAASAAVIATGGGMVLRPENMEVLSAAGVVFFLDRAPEDIAGEDHAGRPLIGGDRDKVFRLYTERIHLYKKYAKFTISHTKTAQEAASLIAAIFLEECEA